MKTPTANKAVGNDSIEVKETIERERALDKSFVLEVKKPSSCPSLKYSLKTDSTLPHRIRELGQESVPCQIIAEEVNDRDKYNFDLMAELGDSTISASDWTGFQ